MSQHSLDGKTRWSHGLGAMANGAQLQIGGLLLLFYNQIMGLPAPLVSLALGISVLLDAFWDPAIGQYSDRLTSRWGRRHPLMTFAVLPTVIGFLMIWNPPHGWSDGALFAWLAVSVIGTKFIYSFFEVPANALTPELAPGYHQRTRLIAYRWVLGSIGAGLTAFLAFGVFLKKTPQFPQGQLNPAGYAPMSIAIALLIGGAMIVNILGTRQHIPRLHKPSPKRPMMESLRQIGRTLWNRNFGVAIIAGALAGIGYGVQGGLNIYMGTYFWHLSSIGILLMSMVILIAAPLSALVARPLSIRFGKKRACMALFFACVLVLQTPLFLRLNGLFVANNTPALLPLLLLFALVGGVFAYGGFILVSSMLSDIVEEAQVKTGERSEGLIMSADNLVQKIIQAFGTVLPGLILAWVAFPAKAVPGQVPAETLSNLGWTFLGLSVILSLCSIATWSLYRIDQAAHEERLRLLGLEEASGIVPAE